MSIKEPQTEAELKSAITALTIETGRGLWAAVVFEEIEDPGNEGWCASEASAGSSVREILYCGIEGLKNSYRELVEWKAFIDSGEAERFNRNARGISAELDKDHEPEDPGELDGDGLPVANHE